MPLLRGRPVECAGRELTRPARQVRTADLGDHAVERRRVRLLVDDFAAGNALGIALAVDRERARVAGADARRQPLPLVLRCGHDLLGIARGGEEAVDGGTVAGSEGAVEGVADDRHRALGAQALHHGVHGERAAKPLAFQLGAEVPECEGGVSLALQGLLREQRRGTVDHCCVLLEVDAAAPRQRLQQQPALVDRPARHRELAAFEVGEPADLRACRHHNRTQHARRGIEDDRVAERTLARHPQPIGQHEIGRAAPKRDLARFRRGKLDRLDVEIALAVEAVGPDHIELPRQRAGFLHRKTNAAGGCRLAGRQDRERNQQ